MLGTAELRSLVDLMVETMRAAPGVGLAAPQIGVGLAVVVLEDKEEYIAVAGPELATQQGRQPFDVLAIVNPRLRALGSGGARFFEGVLGGTWRGCEHGCPACTLHLPPVLPPNPPTCCTHPRPPVPRPPPPLRPQVASVCLAIQH